MNLVYNHLKKILKYFCFLLIFLILQPCFSQNLVITKKNLDNKYIVKPEGFPEIGAWMFNDEFEPADWLEHKINGRLMQEPINIIIIDSLSKSSDEAISRLLGSCQKAGFESRSGHSTKYIGYIGGNFYKQLPTGNDKAFSDSNYTTNNNHGRIFGPYLFNNRYYFIGAFSREDYIQKTHKYDSFIIARDTFADKMDSNTNYHIDGKVNLNNDILTDPKFTSGDHDGMAIVLSIKN